MHACACTYTLFLSSKHKNNFIVHFPFPEPKAENHFLLPWQVRCKDTKLRKKYLTIMRSKDLKNRFLWPTGFTIATCSVLYHNSLGPKYTNYGSEGPIKTLPTTLASVTTVSEDLHNLLRFSTRQRSTKLFAWLYINHTYQRGPNFALQPAWGICILSCTIQEIYACYNEVSTQKVVQIGSFCLKKQFNWSEIYCWGCSFAY